MVLPVTHQVFSVRREERDRQKEEEQGRRKVVMKKPDRKFTWLQVE